MQKESFPSERYGAPCSLLDKACDPENPVVVTGERVLGKLTQTNKRTHNVLSRCNSQNQERHCSHALYHVQDVQATRYGTVAKEGLFTRFGSKSLKVDKIHKI